jgi:hypothetical protein
MKLFVHEATVNPKDDPTVQARGRDVEHARTTLAAIEQRARELEAERESSDELRVLTAAVELSGVRHQHIAAKADLLAKQRAYDDAFQTARGPWLQQARETYRAAALDYVTWLEDVALPVNQKMVAAQEAAEQAGLRVEPLHIPHLLPDAVAHRCRIGRQGLAKHTTGESGRRRVTPLLA